MIIGILGAGQLGRMLALAAHPLGVRCRLLDPSENPPAAAVAQCVQAAYDDEGALRRFVDGLDVVTYEFENVPLAAAQLLAPLVPLQPPARSLEVAQDRLHEKELFSRLGIPTPAYAAVSSYAHLKAAVASVGLPAVLKTRRLGYDGKGQCVLRETADVRAAWDRLGTTQLLLEGFVTFDRELSQLAVRAADGKTIFYPLVENEHRDGILYRTRAPAPRTSEALQRQAEQIVGRIAQDLGHVGVLAVEFFEVGGRLLANEIAPRVHNSGHWTIEGAITSQFENHIRAILGWPLGSTDAVGHSVMRNFIGTVPSAPDVLSIRGAHVHLYDKEPRAGRKLGHVTVTAESEEEAARLADALP